MTICKIAKLYEISIQTSYGALGDRTSAAGAPLSHWPGKNDLPLQDCLPNAQSAGSAACGSTVAAADEPAGAVMILS